MAESPFGDFDASGAPVAAASNGDAAAAPASIDDLGTGQPAPSLDDAKGAAASSSPPPDDKTPTALSKWEEKRAVILKDRESKEVEVKKDLRKKAQSDIQTFYAQRNERMNQTKTRNRNEEKTSKADIANVNAHGTMWEKVGKEINLQPKVEKGDRKTSTDRMRKLLIQLKNEKSEKKDT